MNKHLATSITSPKSKTAGKRVFIDVLHLDEIPGAMEKMGWKVSARMMRRWFASSPAYVMDRKVRQGKERAPLTQINDQIIKMNWVLQFTRSIAPFEQLVANWHTPAGISLLKERLTSIGWRPGVHTSLGSESMLAHELDSVSQVNRTDLGSKIDTLDDMYGALGKASYKIAVVGKTRLLANGDSIFELKRLGVYLRDTYDFNDENLLSEPLGIWNRERCLTKAETAMYLGLAPAQIARSFQGFVPIFNSDFRRWQKAHNSGGDFVVFSDVKWITPPVRMIRIPC